MRTGNYRHQATLQIASPTTDELQGRTEDTWVSFGTWRCSNKPLPSVKGETDATVSYVLEGLYWQEIWDRFYSGKTVRVVIGGMTLKVLAIENVQSLSRALKVHAAKAIAT